MNKGRSAYLVAFIVILGAIFLAEVRLPGNFPFGGGSTTSVTAPHESCTNNWNVTGYFTPVETDYTGPTQTVTVNGTARSFYSSFLQEVQVEGWGQTKQGDFIGYDNSQYSTSPVALNSLGGALKLGDVAVDFSVVQAGAVLTIPTLPSPWNTTRLIADDSGVGVVGKHIDVYTGLGSTAKQETFRIMGYFEIACQLVMGGATASLSSVVAVFAQGCGAAGVWGRETEPLLALFLRRLLGPHPVSIQPGNHHEARKLIP